MPRKDFSQIAFDVVQQAIGEQDRSVMTDHQTNSRRGGIIGGAVRAKKLTAHERRTIAQKAAIARWHKNKP